MNRRKGQRKAAVTANVFGNELGIKTAQNAESSNEYGVIMIGFSLHTKPIQEKSGSTVISDTCHRSGSYNLIIFRIFDFNCPDIKTNVLSSGPIKTGLNILPKKCKKERQKKGKTWRETKRLLVYICVYGLIGFVLF